MELRNCPKTKEEWRKPWFVAVYGTVDLQTAREIVDDMKKTALDYEDGEFVIVGGPDFANLIIEFIPLLEGE